MVDTSLLPERLVRIWPFARRAAPLPKWTEPQPERAEVILDTWLRTYEQLRIERYMRNYRHKAHINKENITYGYRKGVGKAVLQAIRTAKRAAHIGS